MKLKYFSYLAEQSFKTSPDGERQFFFLSGFWSRPYIIPDQETEKRLFRKLLWIFRIFLGALILSALFASKLITIVSSRPLGFVVFFLAIMGLFYLVNWLIFRKDLQNLKRANSRLPVVSFYRDTARRHSTVGLLLGLLGSIGFIWVGTSMITDPSSTWIGWVAIVFFGVCAIAWGYTLFLKLTMPKDTDINDGKPEA